MPKKKKEILDLDLNIYTKSGKLRKRKRKKSIEYFNSDTEKAIVDYNNSEDQKFRNKIFDSKINYSIHKLAENIIHTFKFQYNGSSNFEELKHEVVTFLLGKLPLYNQSLGKAYSYFGTIAKRYLIQLNMKNYKEIKRKADIEEVDTEKNSLKDDSYSKSDHDLKNFMDLLAIHLEKKIDWYFMDINEREVAYTILGFIKNRENLDVFNKQIFYLYAKEISGQPSTVIAKTLKKFKYIYTEQFNNYYIDGGLETDEYDIYN